MCKYKTIANFIEDFNCNIFITALWLEAIWTDKSKLQKIREDWRHELNLIELFYYICIPEKAEVAKLVDALLWGGSALYRAWEFESPLPHKKVRPADAAGFLFYFKKVNSKKG